MFRYFNQRKSKNAEQFVKPGFALVTGIVLFLMLFAYSGVNYTKAVVSGAACPEVAAMAAGNNSPAKNVDSEEDDTPNYDEITTDLDMPDVKKAALSLYDYVNKGDVDGFLNNLVKKDIAEKIKQEKADNNDGNLATVAMVIGLVRDKKAVAQFKTMKAQVISSTGNNAEVLVRGMATVGMVTDGKAQTSTNQVFDRILLTKEDGVWKVTFLKGVVGAKKGK
ncbi:MAG: hypothetical protein LWY06_04410 [Firmicutes bacterium]|nr:hypothetical protein [Bacillota bacterium]